MTLTIRRKRSLRVYVFTLMCPPNHQNDVGGDDDSEEIPLHGLGGGEREEFPSPAIIALAVICNETIHLIRYRTGYWMLQYVAALKNLSF